MTNACPGCATGAPTIEKKFGLTPEGKRVTLPGEVMFPKSDVELRIEAQNDEADLRQHRIEEDTILLRRARARHLDDGNKRPISWWYGRRVTSARRTYVCYLCGQMIDTESANWRTTAHVDRAIEAHRRLHLCEPEQLLFEQKAGMD